MTAFKCLPRKEVCTLCLWVLETQLAELPNLDSEFICGN